MARSFRISSRNVTLMLTMALRLPGPVLPAWRARPAAGSAVSARIRRFTNSAW